MTNSKVTSSKKVSSVDAGVIPDILKNAGLVGHSKKACSILANEFGHTSRHLVQLARLERARKPVKYQTWESLPDIYKDRIFVDDIYLEVRPTSILLAANKLQKLSDSDRKAVATIFGKHKPSLSYKNGRGSNNGTLDREKTIVLNAKTRNIPLADVLAVVNSFPSDNGGWLELEGVKVRIINADFTINIPAAVFPVDKEGRKPIADGNLVPKTNHHYNGLQSITWTETDKDVQTTRNVRYNTDGKVVMYAIKGRDYKFYDKLVMHLETTGVESSNGNNLTNLFSSTALDINDAFGNTETQQEGFGRLEIRCSRGFTPQNELEVEQMLAGFYDAVVARYGHSESFNDTFGWFLNPDGMQQVAYVRGTNCFNQKFYCTIVSWGNMLTNNYRVESVEVEKENINQFLATTKLPNVPLQLDIANYSGKNTRFTAGDTEHVPNISYLNIEQYQVNNCRAKWANQKPDSRNFGENFPFQVTNEPARNIPNIKFSLVGKREPNLSTKAERETKVKLWATETKKRQTKIKQELAKSVTKDFKQSKKFSLAPAEALVVGCYKDKFRDTVIVLDNGYGYKVNAALSGYILSIQNQLGTLPILFEKGAQTGKFNGHPVFGNAKITLGCSEKICDGHDKLSKYSILFWDTLDFERYKDVEIR